MAREGTTSSMGTKTSVDVSPEVQAPGTLGISRRCYQMQNCIVPSQSPLDLSLVCCGNKSCNTHHCSPSDLSGCRVYKTIFRPIWVSCLDHKPISTLNLHVVIKLALNKVNELTCRSQHMHVLIVNLLTRLATCFHQHACNLTCCAQADAKYNRLVTAGLPKLPCMCYSLPCCHLLTQVRCIRPPQWSALCPGAPLWSLTETRTSQEWHDPEDVGHHVRKTQGQQSKCHAACKRMQVTAGTGHSSLENRMQEEWEPL